MGGSIINTASQCNEDITTKEIQTDQVYIFLRKISRSLSNFENQAPEDRSKTIVNKY